MKILAVLLLVSYNGFVFATGRSGRSSPCSSSCLDCFRKELCTISNNEKNATELILRHLTAHFNQSVNSTNQSNQTNGSCVTNNVRFLTAYLFDLPSPNRTEGCNSTNRCRSGFCMKDLANMTDWQLFNSSCNASDLFQARKRTTHQLIITLKTMLQKEMNRTFFNIENDQNDFNRFAAIVHTLPQNCPSPKRFTMGELISLSLKIINRYLQCRPDYVYDVQDMDYRIPCDEHNYNLPHDSSYMNYDDSTLLNYDDTTYLNYDDSTYLKYDDTTYLNYDDTSYINYGDTTYSNFDLSTDNPINYNLTNYNAYSNYNTYSNNDLSTDEPINYNPTNHNMYSNYNYNNYNLYSNYDSSTMGSINHNPTNYNTYSNDYSSTMGPLNYYSNSYSAHSNSNSYSAHSSSNSYGTHSSSNSYSMHSNSNSYSTHSSSNSYSMHSNSNSYSTHSNSNSYSTHLSSNSYSTHSNLNSYTTHSSSNSYSTHSTDNLSTMGPTNYNSNSYSTYSSTISPTESTTYSSTSYDSGASPPYVKKRRRAIEEVDIPTEDNTFNNKQEHSAYSRRKRSINDNNMLLPDDMEDPVMSYFDKIQDTFMHDKSNLRPIPVLTHTLNAKLLMLLRIQSVISSYMDKESNTCYNQSDIDRKSRCAQLADPYFFAKSRLISSLQRQILGCKNCTDQLRRHLNESCKSESLAKYISSYKTQQNLIKNIYSSMVECPPGDSYCIEERKRKIPPKMFQFGYDMIKRSGFCKGCHSQSSKNISRDFKYTAITKLTDLLTECPTVQQSRRNSSNTNVTALIKSYEEMDGSSFILENVQYIMSLPESNITDFDDDPYPHMNYKVSCATDEELSRSECEPHVRKLEVKLYLNMMTQITRCQRKNVSGGFNVCKHDSFKIVNGECNQDRPNKTRANIYALRQISTLTSLLFPSCGNDMDKDPLQEAIKKCSYFAAILGERRYIFGNYRYLEELNQMKRSSRSFFHANSSTRALVQKLYNINHCRQTCPNGYSFCNAKFSCLPEWLPCYERRQYTMLPRMYSNNLTSMPVFVRNFSRRSISMINRKTDVDYDGDWQYVKDNRWVKLSSLPVGSAVKLGPGSEIRYVQHKYRYGFRMFSYFEDSSDALVGEKTRPQSADRLKVAYMLIHPVPAKFNVTVHRLHHTVVLNEDEYWSPGIALSNLIHLRTRLGREFLPIPREFSGIKYSHNQAQNQEYQLFTQNLQKFENSRPVAKIKSPYQNAGRLHLKIDSYNETYPIYSNYIPLDFKKARLALRPSYNWYGNLTIQMEICNCLSNGGKTFSEYLNITFLVRPINDAPSYRTSAPRLPPISYNLTDEPNVGFTIKELIKLTKTTDAENGTDIGIMIHTLPAQSRLGKWQQLNGSNWVDIEVKNRYNPFKVNYRSIPENTKIYALYLNSSDRIRFKVPADTYWTYNTAMAKAFLGFCYWDGSDGISTGNHTVRLRHVIESNSYTSPIQGIQLRKGCNNRPGSVVRYDVCGICGGNGRKCLSCDGVKGSDARIDKCGKCTGGTTGLKYNYLIDCAGTCGLSERDDCGICQLKGSTKRKRNFKDCNSDCFGRARLDKCGVCSGGKTQNTFNADLDSCGVCNGDNSRCKGCDGVANSGKIFDACGECLYPTNPIFDSNCVTVKSLTPMVVPSTGDETIYVSGSGFNSDDITCSFNGSQVYKALIVQGSRRKNTFKILTQRMTAGTYKFECSINNIKYELQSGTFRVYDAVSLKLTSITPNRVPINQTVNVTVVGEGFLDTGDVYCLGLMHNQLHQLPGKYIDSTHVECSIPASQRSLVVSTAVSFSKKRWTLSDFKALSPITFTIYAPAPIITSSKLAANFRTVSILFNKPAWVAKRSCASLFTESTINKFGRNFRCSFNGTKEFIVSLGSKATIQPNDTISVLKDSFKMRFQSIVEYTPATDAALVKPDNFVKPEAIISGPSKIGVCDRLKITGRKSRGAVGRALTYSWGVEFSDLVDNSSISSNGTDGMQRLKDYLASLKTSRNTIVFQPTDLETGLGYNFTLSVTNFLGETSEEVSLVVTRVADVLPTIDIRGGRIQQIKPGRLSKIQARARLPKCGSVSGGLLFNWEISDTSIVLHEKSKTTPNLYILPGTLLGGETYTFTLTVSFQFDQAMFTSASVQVDVLSSPLVTKVRGGNRVVSEEKDFVLDGSLSYDPDREPGDAWYTWECFDKDDMACFIVDPNNTDQYIRYQMPSTARVTIQNKTLDSNQTYTFKFNYYKGLRVKSKTVKIHIKTGNPPTIKMAPQRKFKEDVGRLVVLRGKVFSKASRDTRIWIECADEEEYAYINVTEPGVLLTRNNITRKRAGVHPIGAVFNKNVLTPGVTYKFIVYAENSQGLGSSEVFITTNSPPSEGVLQSDLLNGTALQTEFVVSAVEGWEDSPDDLPLLYTFGYYSQNNRRHYLGAPSFESEKTIKLPSGNPDDNNELRLFTIVSDVHGARSEGLTTVTVSPPEKIDKAAITDMESSISEAMQTEDLSSALSMISTTLSTFDNTGTELGLNSTNSTEELANTLMAFKENITNNVLSMVGDVEDKETQNVILQSMGEMTKNGTKFKNDTKLRIASSINTIVKEQIGVSVSRRKRRSVEDESIDDGAKTPEEIEYIVEPFVNIISPNSIDVTTMSLKGTFSELTTNLLTSMCKGIAYEQPTSVAKSDLADIQATKNDFRDINETAILLGCENCTRPARVVLRRSVYEKYGSWECGSETCSGACVASVQFKHDLFSTQQDRTAITDTISIRLIDPETYTTLSTGTLDERVSFEIPMKAENDSKYQYDCEMWNDVSSKWSTANCISSNRSKLIEGVHHAVCDCDQLGTISVVSNGEIIENITELVYGNATVERTQPSRTANVKLRLLGDFDATVTKVGLSALEASTKSAIVSALSIEEWRIKDLNCSKGSILVSFTLLPPDEGMNPNALTELNQTLVTLESLVKNGTLVVKLSDNSVLSIDTEYWLKETEEDLSPAPTTPPLPPASNQTTPATSKKEESSSLIGLYIALGVVGGILVIVGIFVLVKKFKPQTTSYVV